MGIIRRNFVYLYCLLVIPGLAQEGTAQKAYSISVPEGSSLDQILKEVRNIYEIDFAYPSKFLGEFSLNEGYYEAPDLGQFLDQLFSRSKITYKIIDYNQVLLRITDETFQNQVSAVSGRITDSSSGDPLPDVAVLLDTLMLGTYTDSAGKFSLDIPAGITGRFIQIRMLGYKTENILLSDISEFSEVRLIPLPVEFPEIVVAYKLPLINMTGKELRITMDKSKFSLIGASGLAGEDLFRKIQLLPGIAAHDDLSTKIKIRGSEASETLILLDGIPIYRADHFYGIFSGIDDQYIEHVDIYKNGLPVQYGGRTGGMVSMHSDPNIEHFNGSVDLNLLTASAQIKGSISDRVKFLINGRTTYDNAAQSKFFDWIEGDSDFYLNETQAFPNRSPLIQTMPSLRFYDINSKLIFTPGPRHQIDVNFYRSQDDLANEYENQFTNRIAGQRVAMEEFFSNLEEWDNTGISLNYGLKLNDSWNLKSTFHYSDYQYRGDLTSQLVQGDPVFTKVSGFTNRQINSISDWGSVVTLSKMESESNHFQFGLSTKKYGNEYELSIDQDYILQGENSSWEHSVFGEYNFRQPGKWDLNLGLRTSYYSETSEAYLSPRIHSILYLSSKVSVKASYSRPFQFIREISHEDRLGRSLDVLILTDGDNFPVSSAHNLMAGIKFEAGSWLIDAELYRRNTSNVLEHALLFPGFQENEIVPSMSREYLILTGTGRTLGMDLLVGYNKGDYSGWLAYTLSESINRFGAIQRNEAFPSQDDRRHQLKWINVLNLGKFDLSFNYIFTSGKPYSDFSRLDQRTDRRNISPADRIRRLPSYHRIDIGASYPFSLGHFRGSLGISVFNLTDNQNVKFLQYIYSIPAERPGQNLPRNLVIGNQTGLIDRTFNLDFKVEF